MEQISGYKQLKWTISYDEDEVGQIYGLTSETCYSTHRSRNVFLFLLFEDYR